jgi:anhydro-N-acetylmuramic acid kinase
MTNTQTYRILGVMSGTSLDGLDLACCEFYFENDKWNFSLLASETIKYTSEWKNLLSSAYNMKSTELLKADHSFGQFIAENCVRFLKRHDLKPELIASHGHTIFHQPGDSYSLQIGNGNDIAAVTGIPVVFDFRSMDISLGGQGAPLVPAGDKLLFSEFEVCLNLGGFSNISFDNEKGDRLAFDICPVNIILNHLISSEGKEFDENGETGKKGKVDNNLLLKLENLPYYNIPPPKSLGREFVDNFVIPFILDSNLSTENSLRTYYEHISNRISSVINSTEKKNTFVTGGGAKNSFLMELIKEKTHSEILIPSDGIIDFKEAIIFAFLGLLRRLEKVNCLASVTGATSNSSGGVLVVPPEI